MAHDVSTGAPFDIIDENYGGSLTQVHSRNPFYEKYNDFQLGVDQCLYKYNQNVTLFDLRKRKTRIIGSHASKCEHVTYLKRSDEIMSLGDGVLLKYSTLPNSQKTEQPKPTDNWSDSD